MKEFIKQRDSPRDIFKVAVFNKIVPLGITVATKESHCHLRRYEFLLVGSEYAKRVEMWLFPALSCPIIQNVFYQLAARQETGKMGRNLVSVHVAGREENTTVTFFSPRWYYIYVPLPYTWNIDFIHMVLGIFTQEERWKVILFFLGHRRKNTTALIAFEISKPTSQLWPAGPLFFFTFKTFRKLSGILTP